MKPYHFEKPCDAAPSVVLHEIETGSATHLFDQPLARPVILVFGSFT